jgi:hypothetical protein
LITPFGFATVSHALGLGLKNLAFFLGLAIDTIEWDGL